MARQQHSVTDSVEEALRGVAGVVNASPVGMLPSVGTPVPDSLLHAGLWVADAVYSPLWTPLLTAAKAKGARVMTGRELAIYQAADAFELFTGLAPSITEMGIAFDAVMAKRYAAHRLPSLHAPLRVVEVGGRGRRARSSLASSAIDPPPPTAPPLRGGRGEDEAIAQLPLNEL